MIGGVCGGIAEYLDVDPTLVRIIWAISSVYGGIGVIAYIVCLIVIPENGSGWSAAAPARSHQPRPPEGQGNVEQMGEEYQTENGKDYGPAESSDRNRLLAGTLLICIGGLLLFRRWFYWIDLGEYWPVLLIIAGIIVIINGTKSRGKAGEKLQGGFWNHNNPNWPCPSF